MLLRDIIVGGVPRRSVIKCCLEPHTIDTASPLFFESFGTIHISQLSFSISYIHLSCGLRKVNPCTAID